ncbi:MAG: hypothetical protein M4579_005114 [Chaenotheca gracillima]|nr:MAG: hypothetical protein M4579_005114 [Chaenotheca gracillima]
MAGANGLGSTTVHGQTGEIRPRQEKLTGRAFYESLGSPKMVLAPMVDQSEFAWRMLTRSFLDESPNGSQAAILTYTPMLHARLFAETPKVREQAFQPLKTPWSELSEDQLASQRDFFLDGNPDLDRPLFVQFCANDPDELFRAAKYVEPFCDAVDLNLGCPQGIAKKGNYGAFLQDDWDLVYKLINRLHQGLSVPVTAKIRILETKEKTLEYAQVVLAAGASILTVHGRQRDQKGHNTGLADWSVIRYLRDSLPADTVLFANGNILRHSDIEACLEATGVDGIMSAEGNLSDPSIFAAPPSLQGRDSREYWQGRDEQSSGWRMDAVMRRYMDIIYKYVLETNPPERRPLFLPSDHVDATLGESNGTLNEQSAEEEQSSKKRKREEVQKARSPNLMSMQAHLFSLLKPLVAKHTNVRDALARCRGGDIPAFERVLTLVEAATKQGLSEYVASQETQPLAKGIPPTTTGASSITEEAPTKPTADLVRKPYFLCQPYVRPLPAEAIAKGSMTISKKERRRLAMEAEQASKEKEDKLAKDAGLVPGGTTELETVGATERETGQEDEKGHRDQRRRLSPQAKEDEGSNVEVPRQGLVCG